MTRAPLAAELSQMPPTPERRRAVYALWQTRTKTEVARLTGLSLGQVGADLRWCMTHDGKPRKGRARADRPAPETREGSDLPRFEVYRFSTTGCDRPRLPVFDGEPHIRGDCVVAGDFQLPTTDFQFAGVLRDVAEATGIKTLLIVGDWVNMDAFSRFEHVVPPISFEAEARASVALMEHYAAWFDVIWLALGNHEHRLLKIMRGDIDNSMLGRLLSTAGDKLRVTPYSHIVIHSGSQVWRATHQLNYSRLKGRVGDDLAQKFQCNIITHHQHHTGKIMDRYGRYVIIDNGGLHASEMMAYVGLRDSTIPVMTKGFTVIQGGVGELVTPYPAFTDMSRWLGESHALDMAA